MLRHHWVFVLGLFDTGLGVIRSLGSEGVSISGLDSNPAMIGFRSRYCVSRLCPDPVQESEQLCDFLVSAGRKLTVPGILMPTSDTFLLFISRYRERLATYFKFNVPSAQIIESIANKRTQYEMAEKARVPCPVTLYPTTLDDIERMKEKLNYPVFIKPLYSYQWQAEFPGVKGFKIHDADELIECYKVIEQKNIKVMVQEIIQGPNTHHYKVNVYIDGKGSVLALFTLRKIRQYPVEFGVGSCVESIHSEEVSMLGLKFLEYIRYRGVGSIEFKQDTRDNRLKLIELNPRFWQQNGLATACGINFPLIQYLDLTGQNPEPQHEFKVGIKWLDTLSDFQSFWEYFKKGKLSLWSWIRSLKGTRTLSTFSLNDPGPFFKNHQYGLKYLKLPFYLWSHRDIKK
jgi:D-aspartate ligase